MKTLHKFLFAFSLLIVSANAFGQDANDAKALVSRGVALNDSGKYDEAIAVYKQAIKVAPDYPNAYYECAYTLFVSGKESDAIPYLEKEIKLAPNSGGGFDMLGSIYDDLKQPDKAVDYYTQGIKVDPGYQRLHFNLAISYLRQGKSKEAETCAIDAIKLDPKHASSQRVYALATYNLKKRAASLFAWCSFLLLEPQSKRSAEAYNYVDNILHFGISKTGANKVNISISPDDMAGLMMPMTVLAATVDKKGLSAVDSLQLQLTSLFKESHIIVGKKEDPFVLKYFSDYFEKLGNTDNMPAFARLISLSVYKQENIQWFKDNDDKLKALDLWIRTTERNF